ncbi:MAG: sulfotransferase domain-containing protein [Candidatus Magasanikbacteria bacterium]
MKTEKKFKVDFIGIGAQKCATTWMYECLKEHPQICMSKPKEVNFFNQKYAFSEETEDNWVKGMDWYKKHFRHCSSEENIRGEFSVNYLYDSKAPKRIKEKFPNIKLIVCLRDPVERAISQYSHCISKYKHFVKKYSNFKEAVKDIDEFIERGLYFEQLKRYFNFFNEEQILVLFYDDIQKNPVNFIQKIYKFLSVDTNFTPNKATQVLQPYKKYKFTFFKDMLNDTYRFTNRYSRLIKFLKKSGLYSLGKYIKQLNEKRVKKKHNVTIDPYIKMELEDKFRDDIKKLEELLDKDLSFWGNY